MLFEDFYVKMDRRKDTPQMARLRRFVECGLQVFLLVTFAMFALQSPLFGVLAIMCYPAPILFIAVRFGLREALFVAMLSFAIEGVLLNPFVGLQLFMLTAPVGMLLGYMVRAKMPYFKVICVTSIFASLIIVATISVLSCFFSEIATPLQSFTFFPSFSDLDFTGIDTTSEEGFRVFLTKALSLGWPLFLFVGGMAMTIPSIAWGMRLLEKLGENVNEISLERFESFRLPIWFSVAIGFAFVALYAGIDMQSGLLYQVGLNLTLLCLLFGFVGGCAVLLWIGSIRKWNIIVKMLLIFGLTSFSITSILIPLIGLVDPAVDFRTKYRVRFNSKGEKAAYE